MPLVIQKSPGENVSNKALQVVKQKGGRVLLLSWGNSRADAGF